MKNVLKIFIFIMIIFLSPSVFADSYNVSSTITSPSGGSSSGGKYEGTELNGSTGPFNINTRYNGTLTNIRYNLIKPTGIEGDCFWTNMTYTVTMNMATNDWRNRFGSVSVKPYSSYSTNWSNGRITFVSMKKIYFTFKIPSSYTTCESSVLVNISSPDIYTPFTGETNWNLSNVTLSDTLSSGSSGGSSGGTSPTPTPTPSASNQDIIDNQNNNTQQVIDNQNNNTSDIIENNNSNTEVLNETLNNNCKNKNSFDVSYNFTTAKELTSEGLEIINGSYKISPYFVIKPSTEYTLNIHSNNARYTCFYRANKQFVSCVQVNNSNNKVVTPNTAYYMRVTVGGLYNLDVEGPICNNWEQEGVNVTNQKLDDINNSINNNNIDNGVGSDFFNDFEDNQHGLTGIITAPLSTIQSITSKTCQPLQLPIPFTNKNISLPCMTQVYNQRIPTIYNIWKVVSFGIIAYFICVDIFHIVKGFKDPESDKVEVLDL